MRLHFHQRKGVQSFLCCKSHRKSSSSPAELSPPPFASSRIREVRRALRLLRSVVAPTSRAVMLLCLMPCNYVLL